MKRYILIAGLTVSLFVVVVMFFTREKGGDDVISRLETPKKSEGQSILLKGGKGVASDSLGLHRSLVKDEQKQQEKINTVAELIANGSQIAGVSVSDSMEIGDGFFELMGLSDSEIDDLKGVSALVLSDLQQFETHNKELIEESEQKLSYRVKSDPIFVEDLKQFFIGEIVRVSGNEGLSLLGPSLEESFTDLVFNREVSLEFVEDTSNSGFVFEKVKTTENLFDENGTLRGTRSQSKLVNKSKPARTPKRYSHLFDVEK